MATAVKNARKAGSISGMSDLTIKAFIRRRDGWRCIECGISNDEHILTFRRQLEVHRIIPGSVYHPDLCVTLCKRCHETKPRRTDEVLSNPQAFGVTELQLALYEQNPRGRTFMVRLPSSYRTVLRKIKEQTGETFTEVVCRALRLYLEQQSNSSARA